MAPLARISAGVALALAAFAAPAWADVFEVFVTYGGPNAEDDCNSKNQPVFIQAVRHESDLDITDCLDTAVDCEDLGDGFYRTKTCLNDFSFPEPDDLGINPADYVDEAVLYEGSFFPDMHRHYLANAGCTAMGAGEYFQADSDGQTHSVKSVCDATCTTCASTIVAEGCDWIVGVDGNEHSLDFEPAEEPACAAAPYTTPLDDFVATPVDTSVPIRERRTCWALEGGTVYGGWKVTALGDTYCCIERGTFDSGSTTSFSGCDGSHAHTADFFYDEVTATTYQHCYSGYEPETCLTTPFNGDPNDFMLLVQGGAQTAVEPSGPLARDTANAILCSTAGAYHLEGDGANDDYFCTGRGVLVDDGGALRCRMNGCDHTTPHYFTIGPAEAEEGMFCYHTCYESVFG